MEEAHPSAPAAAALKAPNPAARAAMNVSHTFGSRRQLALVLMLFSGFAGLGYQLVWTQQAALWLGHESAAVLAVVAGFFGGLAAGALLLAPRVDRSSNPARWYATCEAVIGLWSLALAFLLGPITNALLELIGPQPSPLWHWSVAFLGVFAVLLPATAAMGATLPAMERVLCSVHREGRSIAALYAANTLGAVIGVLAAAFILIPEFGLRATAGVCATLNLICAVGTLTLFAGSVSEKSQTSKASAAPLATLAITGLLGIGYEVLIVRVLSQVAENTVYTFAILLAVYLIGTALGAALYSRYRVTLGNHLLAALSVTCLLGTLTLTVASPLKAATLSALGPSMSAALLAEASIATAAFLLPTVVMGALFSHLATSAREEGISLGCALGVNTLGAALAPLLFGVILVPLIGPKFALLIVAAGYLALSMRSAWRQPLQWASASALVALGIWLPSLAIIDVPEGGRVVTYTEGATATVSIIEDANGVSSLHIDNRQQEGSSATLYADARQALLPILLHPEPKRALFLGLGTGVTASAAASDPTLQVDAVELLPEVIEASAHFTTARPHFVAADARRYVRASHDQYDVIVSDNFHPARSGSGALYTVEHFIAVRDRLAPGGVFCQWLPLHQLDLDTLRSIVRAFLVAYPRSWAMLATNSLETPVLGLIAHADGKLLDAPALHERLVHTATSPRPADIGITDDLALLGSFVAGPESLAQFAADAPLNTDDHPVVAYRAPRITYVPDSQPRDRLIDLLNQLNIHPDELVATRDPIADSRLTAYWSARNRFIEVGRDVHPVPDVRRMLQQVRDPLLAVLKISPDFRPAYDPLLQMATALAQVDEPAARELLTNLQEVEALRAPGPMRPD